ncbi:MAG TPA: PspA/IM30 family protein [Pseudogracilibacillus sp.]|nr:PspA/IM30 family protein [Pseudogracilibacillus sp.]
MENIFTRMKESITADLHQMLDKKEEKNPMTALDNYLRQSELQKEKVKKLLQRQYQLKEQFTSEYHQADDLRTKRKKQAEIAKQANETDLYNFAQSEFEEYDHRANRMQEARENAVEQIEQLEKNYKEMNHKLKNMRLKRMELMGRENVARTNQKMNQILHEDSSTSVDRFQELEQFIETIEKKVNKAYYKSTFDQKIADLEKEMMS